LDNNTLNDFFVNELSALETTVDYLQPFENEDPINAQIQILYSNVVAYKMELVDSEMNVVKTASRQTLYTDTATGFRYIHFNIASTAGLVGCYYALITLGVNNGHEYIDERYISEPIDLQVTHENTVYLDYRNDENNYDMVFQVSTIGIRRLDLLSRRIPTAPLYRLRMAGGLWSKDKSTASKDVIYINEIHDARILNGVPYNIYTWSFGDGYGIPFWMYDKLARIWDCSDVQINGQYYTKNEGASVEYENADRYPLRTAKLATLPKENEYSESFSTIIRKKPTGIGFWTIGFDFKIS
jgi:hypothetical protein